MEPSESPSESGTISIGSYETTICLIPPKQPWSSVDRLRALYDKAYEKWPPHVNLVYPFVRVESLEKTTALIQSALQEWKSEVGGKKLRICLDSADVFPHRHDNTIYIHDSDASQGTVLQSLRRVVLRALGHKDTQYHAHMTIGQSENLDSDVHKFLLHKVSLLPTIEWEVTQLSILVRERTQHDGTATGRMKLWGTVSVADGSLSKIDPSLPFYDTNRGSSPSNDEEDTDAEVDELQSSPPYYFDEEVLLWKPYSPQHIQQIEDPPTKLAVASYNVLAEFEWPPSQARYPLLVKNILSRRAAADVLVLQEVTDDFLGYLLRDEGLREAYPFVSHGPPDQADIEPLPSLLNLIVLSKVSFNWEWVSFKRQHKGSLVVKFQDIGAGQWDDEGFRPLIMASVHLTCGLTDGSVSNKKIELQRIVNYLKHTYPDNPWILAGDFNVPTSSFTLEAALKKKAISAQSAEYISPGFEDLFWSSGLEDAWSFTRHQLGDASDDESSYDGGHEIFDGEQGATFNPLTNTLASKIVGSGFNNRPQRYDRILVRRNNPLRITKFNKFGFLTEHTRVGTGQVSERMYASDHWGVRCLLNISDEEPETWKEFEPLVDLMIAPRGLKDAETLRDVLERLNVFPSAEEVDKRSAAFSLLKSVLVETSPGEAGDSTALSRVGSALVIAPVGSYGLGVWTATSDIDCMCIGPFSSNTFFALATQRLRKAATQGVKIIRRVRATSGTMLELEVQGIKMDLQYCPATAVAEGWPEVLRLPSSDPTFTLPTQTLSKLKAARDLDYLRRSIPDLTKFRTAHRFIKTWAKSRGIYAAKFGYLGGFQISILLARVCKILMRDNGEIVAVPDILSTFFGEYASFDWKNDIVFDPFFHKQRLQYTRTSREPLAIVGYYPPSLNTSHNASLPTVRTMAEEYRRASKLIGEHGMTWAKFLCNHDMPSPNLLNTGATDFLTSYKSYVKIDVQYWGVSLTKGASFVGWLESRCVMLLVDINRRLPNIHARIWPARFVQAASTDDDRDYQGHYLVGLDKLEKDMSKDHLKIAFGALQTVLHRFEEQIRSDEKYFDAKSQWMSASIVNQSELRGLRIDGRDWGEYTPGDDESDEEEDEDDEDLADELLQEGDEDGAASARKKGKKGKKQIDTVVVPKLETGKKFRTAHDVIKRLRWDPNLDSGDYIVGYEDRFTGAREKALDMWKSEQTDEEFIPQHRVLYFKRSSDGVIVWERKTRKDDIFGSGI